MPDIFTLNFESKEGKPNAQKVLTGKGFQTLTVSFTGEQAIPAHKHPNMNVLVYVVKGELELVSDTARTSVAEGQLVCFSGDDAHALENSAAGQTNVLVTAIPKPS